MKYKDLQASSDAILCPCITLMALGRGSFLMMFSTI
jgi:hypothetical protein